MRNTLETRIGLFVALIAIAAVLVLETLGVREQFQKGKEIQAAFQTVQELRVGDRVKMAGVEVGQVTRIALTNNQVLVTMKVQSDAPIKTDSTARIKFAGLLGQNYVSLDFGSPDAPEAMEGFPIQTEEQPDLSAIMEKMDKVASGVENLTRGNSQADSRRRKGKFGFFQYRDNGINTSNRAITYCCLGDRLFEIALGPAVDRLKFL